MSIIRNIKRDKRLEPYFLNLSEWIYRTKDLNEEGEAPFEYNQAFSLLHEKLLKQYKISSNIDLPKLIIEVIDYYRSKYSIQEQFDKNEKWRLKNNLENELD